MPTHQTVEGTEPSAPEVRVTKRVLDPPGQPGVGESVHFELPCRTPAIAR